MASPPIPSALDARTQTFPALTPEQVQRVACLGAVRNVHAGEILFEPGDVNIPFFVLLSGSMEIVQPDIHGERLIAKHERAGEFTGEMTMISGQQCLARGRVTSAGEFVEIASGALRTLVARDAELSEILLRAFILRRVELIQRGFGNVIVLGSRHSARTLDIREFLSRNGYPYSYVDLDADQTSQELLDRFEVKASEVPVVVCNARNVLRNPSIAELTNCLGLNVNVDTRHVRDVVIVGAGPAGLAAAVYAASEGLDTLVIETHAPGGQAGSSSKIENYLGFPTGISGQELAARASTQAQKFGANLIIAHQVVNLNCEKKPYALELDSGEPLLARSVVIATGAQYNKLKIPDLDKFESKGVYYGATFIEAQLCGSEQAAVVGGANSAGQAAVFLSQTLPVVHMLVRAGELKSTMSRYLIQRITENPRIHLHFNTEIVALHGDDQLESVTWRDKISGETSTNPIRHVFVMTGASPQTAWLRGCVALDPQGFILTGRELDSAHGVPPWPLERRPQMLETSLPGVFAVGDVRAGNVKRVTSAVGEGAISIYMVHRALAEA